MKVLHIFNEIKFSGAEIMYVNAARIFQEKGIKIFAFSTGNELGDFSEVFKKNGIQVYYWPIKKKKLNITIKALKRNIKFYKFIKKNRIDVLHIHRSDIYFLALVARLAGIPTIKTMHSVFKNRKFTYPTAVLTKFIARKFFNVTFQTIGDSVYYNELNYYKNPTIKINNWYDDRNFYPIQDEKEKIVLRKELNIPENSFVVISVGSCSYLKNHFDIIKAVALLKSEIPIFYLHLGIGTTQQEEIKLSKKLGVYNKISFMGNKKNVRDYLVSSDIYLMPSHYEGMSISAIEAMACGLPSILYNSPGLRDLIKNNDNGFLIEWGSENLAQKIKYLYNNPIVKKQMGENAIIFARENFSMGKNVLKIIELYRNAK